MNTSRSTKSILKASTLLTLVLLLVQCTSKIPIERAGEVPAPHTSVKKTLKRLIHYTKEEVPFYMNQNMDAVDTIIQEYDTLGRLIKYYQIIGEGNENYWSRDSVRFQYNSASDSVSAMISFDNKDGLVRADSMIFHRDSLDRLLYEEYRCGGRSFHGKKTIYSYDEMGRILSIVVKKKNNRISKTENYQYIDSLKKSIHTRTYFKSMGVENFKTIDTIQLSADSLTTIITDFSNNHHGNKYLKKGRCANCIHTITKNKCGKVVQRVRIKRPNDTIFHERNYYDHNCRPYKSITSIGSQVDTLTTHYELNDEKRPVKIVDSLNSELHSTQWFRYEFYEDGKTRVDCLRK